MRTETLAEAARRLVDLADEVETMHEVILLVRAGHPDLALVRADELDAYREWMSCRETEDLIHDPEGQREAAESGDTYRPGEVMTIAEARARLNDDVQQVRARLAAAGLLDSGERLAEEAPPEAEVAAARVRAGRGRPLSEYVTSGR